MVIILQEQLFYRKEIENLSDLNSLDHLPDEKLMRVLYRKREQGG